MSIASATIVDVVSTDPASGEVVLTISDHLDWTESEHFSLLESKISAYLSFVESGQLIEAYPFARDRRVRIDLVLLHTPSASASSTLKNVEVDLASRAIGFAWRTLQSSEA